MRRHLNTLFVTLEGGYIRKDGETVEIRHEGATKLRVSLPKDDSRNAVLVAWQERKQDEITHPFLDDCFQIGETG